MDRGAEKQVSFEVNLPEKPSSGSKKLPSKKNGCKAWSRALLNNPLQSRLKHDLSHSTSDTTDIRKVQRASKEQFYTFARHHSVMIRNLQDVFSEPSEDPEIDDSEQSMSVSGGDCHENTLESTFKFVNFEYDHTPVLADAVPPAVVVKMEPGTSTVPQQLPQPSQPNDVQSVGSAAQLQDPVPSTYHNTNTTVPDGTEVKATNNSRLDHISKVLHDDVLCAELGAPAVKRLRVKYLELLLEE